MNYTTIENTPVTINFNELLNDRSWVLSGSKATHYPCNVNSELKLLTYEILPNVNYKVSFRIAVANSSPSLSIGFSEPLFNYTTAQDVTVELSTTEENQKITFWGNGYLELETINVQKEIAEPTTESEDTITFSETTNRWVSFRSYRPENGFSMFSDMYTYYQGSLWLHREGDTRNNFYGDQFQTVVDFPMGTGIIKNWQSVAIHSNNIMVTTTDGITTQLGQVSDLIEVDFNSREGIHYANFLRDKLTDIINGDRLKGRYISLSLITVDGSQKLQLFKIVTKWSQSTVRE